MVFDGAGGSFDDSSDFRSEFVTHCSRDGELWLIAGGIAGVEDHVWIAARRVLENESDESMSQRLLGLHICRHIELVKSQRGVPDGRGGQGATAGRRSIGKGDVTLRPACVGN